MELTQLRYFQKVARTKSITKAAQDLYISQPTLSVWRAVWDARCLRISQGSGCSSTSLASCS